MRVLLAAIFALLATNVAQAAEPDPELKACAPARPADRGAADAGRLEQEVAALAAAADGAQRLPALLDRLATAYERMDRFDLAEQALARGVALRAQRGADGAELAAVLVRVGLMQRAQGRLADAETTLLRCIALAEAGAGEASEPVAACRNMLGLAWRDGGRYAEAEGMLTRALTIREKVLPADHADLEHTLNLLGTLYLLLGDLPRAAALYERSVAIAAKVYGACHPVYATTLHFLADAYDTLGRPADALPLRRRSQAIREQVLPPEDHSVAHGLMGLAETLLALHDLEGAASAARRAVALHDAIFGRHHYRSLRSLWTLSRALDAAGRGGEAEALVLQGVFDSSAEQTPEFLWRFQSAYRAHLLRRGNETGAIAFGKLAVNTLQSIRSNIATLERALQRSFISSEKVGVYRGLADLLIGQGRLAEAQQVMSMLKEEEYFDFIRRDAQADARTATARFTGAEQPWVKRYAEISARVAEVGTQRQALEQKRRAGLSAAEQAQLKQLEADGDVARRALVSYMDELSAETARLGAQRRAEIARRDVEGLENYQDELKAMGGGVVMLHYVVLPDKVRIVVTAPEIQVGRIAPVAEAELNRKIEAFRDALQNPVLDPRPLAQELYRWLLGPVAADLAQAGAATIMVSLDGALRYLPFAALFDGERYVIERFRVSVLTEAARNRLAARPEAETRFAGLGLTRKVAGFDALPAVREELEGILKDAKFSGEVHFDEAFTAERMRAALSARIPLIHVASHFKFNPGTEVDSFLVLGDGSRLSLRELRESGYNFRGVDLLTLSACETAVGGGADANGREVEGFGALAQQRGARAVMATLWPVADISTGVIMQRFYRLRADGAGMSKAEALRQAQLGLLRGEHAAAVALQQQRGAPRLDGGARKLFVPDSRAPFAHPYFWAPFILMGNWL